MLRIISLVQIEQALNDVHLYSAINRKYETYPCRQNRCDFDDYPGGRLRTSVNGCNLIVNRRFQAVFGRKHLFLYRFPIEIQL
jgi:hypothetical protein